MVEKLGDTSREGRSLSRRIAAVQAAQVLATADLTSMDYQERLGKYTLVMAAGTVVPLPVKVKVAVAASVDATKAFVESGKQEQLADFVKVLVPYGLVGETSWDFMKPNFAHITSEANDMADSTDAAKRRECAAVEDEKAREEALHNLDVEIECRWEAAGLDSRL